MNQKEISVPQNMVGSQFSKRLEIGISDGSRSDLTPSVQYHDDLFIEDRVYTKTNEDKIEPKTHPSSQKDTIVDDTNKFTSTRRDEPMSTEMNSIPPSDNISNKEGSAIKNILSYQFSKTLDLRWLVYPAT